LCQFPTYAPQQTCHHSITSSATPELTDWPIERISEVVQPTDAQRQALDELRAASAKAIEIAGFR
jgi:hypothetical protein